MAITLVDLISMQYFLDIILMTKIPLLGKQKQKNLYKSQSLQSAWCTSDQEPRGYVSVGDVTPESISYVCGYVQKKIYGQMQGEHYKYIDLKTGEQTAHKPDKYKWLRAPEKAFMSRRPGIGSDYYDKYHSDMYRMQNNCIHLNGKEIAVPSYYNKQIQKNLTLLNGYYSSSKKKKTCVNTRLRLSFKHEKNFQSSYEHL